MQRQGFGIRLGAALIDIGILFVVSFVLALVMGGSVMAMFKGGASESQATATATGFLIVMALVPVAYSLMEIFMAATVGKMALGLRIANQDGTPAETGTLAARWAAKNSSSIIGLLAAITGVGALALLGNLAGLAIFVGCFLTLGAAKLALHDMIAKTAVVKPGVVPQGFPVIPPQAPPQ